MKLRHIAAFAIWAVLATPVAAQNLDAGQDAHEQSDLGFRYETGRGVPQDYAEAVRWYRMAAEQGNARGQGNLGFMYANGQGVPQDYAEAVRLYRMAAEQGNGRAQGNLGTLYGSGHGVPRDIVLAHMWFNIASANGYEKATQNRALVVEQMTREQIADAQDRARVCMSSGYQDCE
jgi:TPR repeat protein